MRRVILAITFLSIALTLGFIKRTWTDGDEGRYLSLARSVSLGHGQTAIHLPRPVPEWLTPPAYVWMLGMLDRISHSNMTALRLSSAVSMILSAWLFALYAARATRLDPLSLFCALAVGLFSVQTLAHGWLLMTEATYMAVAALILYLAARSGENPSPRVAFAIGLLSGLSMLIRPAGMAFAPAILIVLLLRRSWLGCATFLLGLALAYSPAIIRSYHLVGVPFPHMTHFEGSPGHSGQSLSPLSLFHNIATSFPGYYFVHLPAHLFFSLFDYHCLLCKLHLASLVRPVSILIGLFIAIGFFARLRRPGVAEFYWLFSWPFLCVYNQPDYAAAGIFLYQPRYLIPILPLAGFYLIEGFAALARRFPVRGIRILHILAAACAAYVLLAATGVAAVRVRNEWALRRLSDFAPARLLASSYDGDHALGRYIEAAQWLGSNAPPDAVVASRKPDHVYLISGLKGFRYDGADLRPSSDVWSNIKNQQQYGPSFIIEDAFPADSGYGHTRIAGLLPVLAAHSNDLELIYETAAPVTRIWRVRAADANDPAAN